jgi:chromosome segregation ATPase
MLPAIVGLVGVGVLTYLYNEAKSDYSSAVDDYYDEVDRQEEEIKREAKRAKKRYELDILYKIKESKERALDTIIDQFISTKDELDRLSDSIDNLEEELNNLFYKKRTTLFKKKRAKTQEQINLLIESKREISKLRDETRAELFALYEEIVKTEEEIAKIEESIKEIKNS